MNFSESKRPSPRPAIERLPPVHHGAPDFQELEELGLQPEDVLDFSVNSNPYGPSPRVWEALKNVPLDRYPDREALALRRTLAEHLKISPERITAGNGTAELLWMIALTYLRSNDNVLLLEPTFGEYANVSRLMGAQIQSWIADSRADFALDPGGISRVLKQSHFRLVFLCNPNNPTGQALSAEVILNWVDDCPQTMFVIDEAYQNFALEVSSLVREKHPNLLILRSMTKDYALAGLRLGYAVGDPQVMDTLAKVRPPWNVNALAQAAGRAALADQEHLETTLKKVQNEKQYLVKGLQERGYAPLPSHTHYFLLPVSSGQEFRSQLMKASIQVRDCASFGLPEHVRIASRTRRENERLLAAVPPSS
jgi:histidinol-phosphate aminotransferase